jgi:hypothetical protein
MEDFIRHASFESHADDFGFLVPTPNPPRLSQDDSYIFRALGRGTYHPHFVHRPVYGLKFFLLFGPTFAGRTAGTAALSPAPVSVLYSQQVAGYVAVVLHADNTAALLSWLKTHGYDARPALTDWLQPYIARHWTITAFKIAKSDAQQSGISSAVVQMSFHTDHPFYPYREPSDQRSGNQGQTTRLLRIYLLSNARMDGSLDGVATPWPGRTRWAEPIAPQDTDVLRLLPSDDLPQSLWLTTFEDTSSPRPGVADLSFTPAAQQTPLQPTVIWPDDRRFGVPIELILIGLIIAGVRIRRRLNQRRQASSRCAEL